MLTTSSLPRGSLSVLPDGLVVARGPVAAAALDALAQIFDQTERRAFRVELVLTSLSEDERDMLAVEASPSASVMASMAGVTSSARVDATMTAVAKRSRSRNTLVPSLALVEGETGTISRGQRILLPVKGVTQSGAIETLRFQTVSAGVNATITVRSTGPKVARLSLDVTSNEVDPSIESLGATRGDTLQTEMEVGVGQWAYVGSLSRDSTSRERSSWLRLSRGKSAQSSDLDCIVRVME